LFPSGAENSGRLCGRRRFPPARKGRPPGPLQGYGGDIDRKRL